MISSLKRQGIYEVSIRLGKEFYEYENDWIDDNYRDFGTICLAFSPSLRYLIDSIEYPKDIWIELDRTFGNHNDDHYRNLESTPNTKIYLYSKLLASILLDEVVRYEEEASSSISIQNLL